MTCINLEICTDTEELLPQIVDNLNDPVEFILAMDEYMADEGFTLDLIKRLAEAMAKEYKQSSDHVTERIVEQEFGSEETPSYMRWSSDDIKNYEAAHKSMSDIIEIINKLTY